MVDGNFGHVMGYAKGGKCYVTQHKCNKGQLSNILSNKPIIT